MKVISQCALREMLRNMHSKVSGVQRPALDRIESAEKQLQVIDLAELVPEEKSHKDIDCDLTDFGKAIAAQGWNDCRAAILRIIEGLEDEI